MKRWSLQKLCLVQLVLFGLLYPILSGDMFIHLGGGITFIYMVTLFGFMCMVSYNLCKKLFPNMKD